MLFLNFKLSKVLNPSEAQFHTSLFHFLTDLKKEKEYCFWINHKCVASHLFYSPNRSPRIYAHHHSFVNSRSSRIPFIDRCIVFNNFAFPLYIFVNTNGSNLLNIFKIVFQKPVLYIIFSRLLLRLLPQSFSSDLLMKPENPDVFTTVPRYFI